MKKNLVSVHMITYNHEPFIRKAIECVLAQKVKFNIELVIGEDFSTDGTRDVVMEYQKRFPSIIKPIISNENIGMKQNVIRTAQKCTGKYIAFCEGDDYWHNVIKLQKQIDYLERHSDCGLVAADCNFCMNKIVIQEDYNQSCGFHTIKNMNIETILWGKQPIWTCTVVVRADLYKQVIENDPYLYKNSEILHSDLQAWAEIATISKVTYIPETFATYRILDESASHSKNKIKHYKFHKSLFETKLYLCKKYNLDKKWENITDSAWCETTLRLAFYQRNPILALEVKNKKKKFTINEQLRFWGAKYAIFYYIFKFISILLNIIKRTIVKER